MVKNLQDLFEIIDNYTGYLKNKSMEFGIEGEPIFKREMFLDAYPQLIVPYDCRNSRIVKDKKQCAICFYSRDDRIYPRFEKIFENLGEYKKFMGIIAPDVTITEDMDLEFQKFIMRLNQLFMAILAVNEVKVVANLRSGNSNSLDAFSNIPKGVAWAASFLGCEKDSLYDNRFISSVTYVLPSKLFLYGKDDLNAINRLNNMGFDFTKYQDFHTLNKESR